MGNAFAIVSTASMIGLWPMPGSPVCAAAKAGVVNFSRLLGYLAEESRIRVNTICPDCPEIVDTPLIAVLGGEVLADVRQRGGLLGPEQIAAVLELIEDESRFGAVMTVTIGGV